MFHLRRREFDAPEVRPVFDVLAAVARLRQVFDRRLFLRHFVFVMLRHIDRVQIVPRQKMPRDFPHQGRFSASVFSGDDQFVPAVQREPDVFRQNCRVFRGGFVSSGVQNGQVKVENYLAVRNIDFRKVDHDRFLRVDLFGEVFFFLLKPLAHRLDGVHFLLQQTAGSGSLTGDIPLGNSDAVVDFAVAFHFFVELRLFLPGDDLRFFDHPRAAFDVIRISRPADGDFRLRPAHDLLDVDDTLGGIFEKHLVVRDIQDGFRGSSDEIFQPDERVEVEIVRRFVE